MSKQEFMNVISKSRLHLIFLNNKPRVGNEQKDFVRLVKRQCKNSFNKTCLNVLRTEDIRWVGIKSNKWQNDKVVRVLRQETRIGRSDPAAGLQTKNNKVDSKQDNKVGKRRDNKTGIGWDSKMGIK